MRKRRRLWIIPLAIVGVLAVAALGLWANGTCRYKGQVAEASAAEWMAKIPDETPLRQVAIPGSHDAGTYGMVWLGRTQNYSVGTQLSFGARYFDIRVNKTDSGYPIYHSVINGVEFGEVLADIKEFIKAHPSEVLILDFQHFKGGSREDVFTFLADELDSEGLVLHNDTGRSDVEFIHSLTVGEARGKCIVFFGETDDDFSDWIFLRNNDECTRVNTAMDSYYLGDCHKAGFDALVGEAHPIYFDLLRQRQAQGTDCIFVLQCQLTDGKLIFGPWSAERGQEERMDAYVMDLRENECFDGVNVVLRDFLTPEKCREIIDLNNEK